MAMHQSAKRETIVFKSTESFVSNIFKLHKATVVKSCGPMNILGQELSVSYHC